MLTLFPDETCHMCLPLPLPRRCYPALDTASRYSPPFCAFRIRACAILDFPAAGFARKSRSCLSDCLLHRSLIDDVDATRSRGQVTQRLRSKGTGNCHYNRRTGRESIAQDPKTSKAPIMPPKKQQPNAPKGKVVVDKVSADNASSYSRPLIIISLCLDLARPDCRPSVSLTRAVRRPRP